MPGELSTTQEIVAAVLLVVQLAAIVLTAAVATLRLVGPDRLVRALTGSLLVLAQIAGVPLVLGMVGLLRLPAVVVAHLLLAGAAVAYHRREAEPAERPAPRSPWTWLELVAVGATTVYLAIAVKLSLHPQRSFEFDTKEYHLANLSSWLQAGHIWGLPYSPPGSMTANHPSTGEMFGLWWALPTHGDELVYLTPVIFAALAVVAGALLGRELVTHRDGAALGALGAVAVVSAPIYFGQVHTLLTDIVAGASALTAVAFLVLARHQPARAAALVGLAGVALGISMGSKYTAVLPGLVIGAVAIALLRRSRAWWWLLPGLLVLAAPWYVRNIITTGNPLFPQPIGPIDGANSPYDVLEASLFDQMRAGETEILRRWVTLARHFLGPLLVLVAAGLVAPFVRRARPRDVVTLRWVSGLAAAGLLLYLITPYTGGGPTGLAFIIASCFRYAVIGVLIAAVTGIVVAGRWIGGAAVAVIFGWNLWEIVRHAGLERPQLDVAKPTFGAALLAGVVVVAVAHLAGRRPDLVRRLPLAATAAVVSVGAIVGAFAAYHRLDRGRTPTTLEATLLAMGEDRPAIVMGVADLRAVLGPRLERPLVKLSRGGAADEIPFADEAQLRRRVLDEDTPPPPPELAEELDEALAEADEDVLVIDDASPVGFPDRWRPDDGWCLAGGDDQGSVFVRPELLPPGIECVTADQV